MQVDVLLYRVYGKQCAGRSARSDHEASVYSNSNCALCLQWVSFDRTTLANILLMVCSAVIVVWLFDAMLCVDVLYVSCDVRKKALLQSSGNNGEK